MGKRRIVAPPIEDEDSLFVNSLFFDQTIHQTCFRHVAVSAW